MRYLIRWEKAGCVFEAKADKQAAMYVFQAILAFWSGDNIPVSLWDGAIKLQDSLS